MTDSNYTYLAFLVDRSGSMSTTREAAQQALKTMVDEQRSLPGELTVNLFQFDDLFSEVPEMEIDEWQLVPRGMTALYDAVGKSMMTVGQRLAAMAETDRPGKVVFVIVTDGEENASREWTQPMVRDLVTAQQDDYGWQVVFTAANLDAREVAATIGAASAMNYAATATGTAANYDTLSRAVNDYRAGSTLGVVVPENAQ